MLATYPIYFSPTSKKQYEELCRQIDFFEAIWASVTFCLKKYPYRCSATQLENGAFVKNMPLYSPAGELWIVFTHNDACVTIEGIRFKERDS